MTAVHFNPSDRLGLVLPGESGFPETERISQIARKVTAMCADAHNGKWNIIKLSRKIIPELSDYNLSVKHRVLNYLHQNLILSFNDKKELSRLVNEIESMKSSLDKKIREDKKHGLTVTDELLILLAKYELEERSYPEKLHKVIFTELMKHNSLKSGSRAPASEERASLIKTTTALLSEKLDQPQRKSLNSYQLSLIVVPVLQETRLSLRSKYTVLWHLEEKKLLSEQAISKISHLLDRIEKTSSELLHLTCEMKYEGTLTDSAVFELVLAGLQNEDFPLEAQAVILNELVRIGIAHLSRPEQKRQIYIQCLLQNFTEQNLPLEEQLKALNKLQEDGFFAQGDISAYRAILQNFDQLRQILSVDYRILKHQDIKSIKEEFSALIIDKRIPKRQIPLMLSTLVYDGIMAQDEATDILTTTNCYFILRDDILNYRKRVLATEKRKGLSFAEVNRKLYDFAEKKLQSLNVCQKYKKAIAVRLNSEI